MAHLTVNASHPGGSSTATAELPPVAPRVAGGLYLGGNTDPRPKLPAVTSAQRYASFEQTGPAIWSGWIDQFARTGGWVNLVLELKCYGTGAAQTFTVEGRTYLTMAAVGAIQLANGGVKAYSYSQVTSGACDGLIHRAMAALRPALAAGARINIQLASEVDTDNEFGTHDDASPLDRSTSDRRAIDAYTYIIDWMKSPPAGITPLVGVTFSLGWAGQWSGRDAFTRCHPDALPVDYLCWNSYNRSANQTPSFRLAETAAYRASARHRQMDILIPEWGTSASHPGGQAPYIQAWRQAVAAFNAAATLAGTGRILMTNYFGSRDATWGALSPEQGGLAALTGTYTASPYLPPRTGTK